MVDDGSGDAYGSVFAECAGLGCDVIGHAVNRGKGAALKTGQPLEAVRAAQQAQVPARRFGNPDEFGAICAFLCSQQAGYITGQNILPDGGAYPGSF